jgi:hypothetical protein
VRRKTRKYYPKAALICKKELNYREQNIPAKFPTWLPALSKSLWDSWIKAYMQM